ncbi:hypothetical protein Rhe02_18670 [Rhizocola hellebori]|uniref:Uncharacterized protein n=1 Tax=Rhizocola hellebori TaxID=1392758 RepID=A0A8J3Q602_9ACTN|nr:hypothetical protein Rhe02_18670 [Rhizocola hellebori]
MTIVTGSAPQLNVVIPPAATALTTAAEVQLAADPVPITRSGREVSTACPSAGTTARLSGLPLRGIAAATVAGDGVAARLVGAALGWPGVAEPAADGLPRQLALPGWAQPIMARTPASATAIVDTRMTDTPAW